ncbi:MAG: glycosyltransferase family 9 protein [Chloroflexi bacterium]|nr:MAG: glycosyltransferase family 9 protein [Chloroflexota bacterium]
MLKNSFDSLQNILAIRLDNIGDVVMLGPALRALRETYPQARLTLMVSSAGSQVAPLLPWVDEIITWRAVWQDIGKDVPVDPEREWELVDLLARRRFDAAFIFTSFSQSPYPPAYTCYLAGIPIRAGQARDFGGGLLTHWVKPPADSAYQVERNLHLLRGLGLPVRSSHLELRIPHETRFQAERILAETGIQKKAEGHFQPYVALAPGASAAARRYDQARYAEVTQKLVAETGLPVVLLGSQRETGAFPALETFAASARAASGPKFHGPPVSSLIGKTSVPELAAIIEQSALLIANNSGSMHMAAAFNRPMVILYSGTDLLEHWSPPFAQAQILNRTVPCAPCYGFHCPYHLECLDIPVDEVVAAAISLLGQVLSPPSQKVRLKTESIQGETLQRS